MSRATVDAINELIEANPELRPVLKEHLDDNFGELLPHLVMADVMRWLVDHRETHLGVARSVLDWMERRFNDGPDDVQGMILVSGLEMIPNPGRPGAELRQLLGPSLRAVDPWLG